MSAQALQTDQTRSPAWVGFFLPTIQDILFLSLFVAVIGMGPRLFNIDGDLGRHLTIGRYILSHHQIPAFDLFSHTMQGQPLVPHEWLAQVIFALAYQAGGLDGVVWLSALLIAFTFTLTFRQSYKSGKLLLVALIWTLVAAAAASLHWLARPHLFTLLLLAIWYGELERIRQGVFSRAWLLPVLMLLWANLHGAFIAGFVVWGIYLLGEMVEWWNAGWEDATCARVFKTMAMTGGGAFAASLLNPAGIHLWETSLGYLRNRYLVGHTAEYLPPDFHLVSAWPFLAMMAASLLLLSFARRRLPASWALLLPVWTVMGLYSIRNVPLYAVIAAPILAFLTAEVVAVEAQPAGTRISFSGFVALDRRLALVDRRLRGWLWPAAGLLGIALLLGRGLPLDLEQRGNQYNPAVFPVQAVGWVKDQNPPGNVFNYFPWGGYLLYQGWPELKVFIDGQTDFYGEALTRQYEQVITLADGWEQVLDEYEIGWVIMPARSTLVKALNSDPAWYLVYQDETTSIFYHAP